MTTRFIAFYLPQFHPIPENDQWWGKGFTEWTNTAKAKPLFNGHYQPHIPADLGFYDLRLPEVRQAQADLAKDYGIEAFCYYHYWFAGKRVLERPFQEVLESGKPDFPFCLCWANHSWSGIWYGAPNRILIEQTYPGEADYRAHFKWLLTAFRDERYLRVEGKPLFVFFSPQDIPNLRQLLALWRVLAKEAGLPGLFLLAMRFAPFGTQYIEQGFDGSVTTLVPSFLVQPQRGPSSNVYEHEKVVQYLVAPPLARDYPAISPNWDNTPRSGINGVVLHNSRPELFSQNLRSAQLAVCDRPQSQQIVFIKAWNEWAEGNHLEPDLKFGHGYLEAIKKVL